MEIILEPQAWDCHSPIKKCLYRENVWISQVQAWQGALSNFIDFSSVLALSDIVFALFESIILPTSVTVSLSFIYVHQQFFDGFQSISSRLCSLDSNSQDIGVLFLVWCMKTNKFLRSLAGFILIQCCLCLVFELIC